MTHLHRPFNFLFWLVCQKVNAKYRCREDKREGEERECEVHTHMSKCRGITLWRKTENRDAVFILGWCPEWPILIFLNITTNLQVVRRQQQKIVFQGLSSLRTFLRTEARNIYIFKEQHHKLKKKKRAVHCIWTQFPFFLTRKKFMVHLYCLWKAVVPIFRRQRQIDLWFLGQPGLQNKV